MRELLLTLAGIFIGMAGVPGWSQTFQTLHAFPANGDEGTRPWATLTIGPDRSLYGTASEGGAGGAGTAFQVTLSGNFTLLGNLDPAETGKAPKARLVNPGDGFLYGASSLGGGTAGDPVGTVIKLDPVGGPTAAGGLTKLFALPGSGSTPMVPLALTSGEVDVLHVLGSSPGGIWRVPTDGSPPTVAFTFPTSGDSGQFPQALQRGADGYLYGVTVGGTAVGTTPGRRGTIFRILPNGDDFTTLHDCLSETGVNPVGGLAEGPNGIFYGTTSGGGANLDGVIFRITAGGEYTVLQDINDHPPLGDLLLATDGRLYGTSSAGGANLFGSIFRINTNGTAFQIIHTFDKANGAFPKGGLVQADDGDLYGVTSEGGVGNQGTIFRIDLGLPPREVNRRPIAVGDQTFSDGSPVTVRVLANDFDPDEGDTLTATIETPPLHGTTTVESNSDIVYTPTSGEYNGFDEFTYRITDREGLFATAKVTISNQAPPAPWQPGPYNGILHLDPNVEGDTMTPRGQLIINITQSGTFTGKLFAQGKRYVVRGAFDESGTAVAIVKLPRKRQAMLFLAPAEGHSLLAVAFTQELWTGALSPVEIPVPAQQARFTLAIERENADLPVGGGYAVMRLLSNGLVVAVGKLGDGSRISWGTSLVSLDGTLGIPVYHAPVPGGAFGGVFIATGSSPSFLGSMRWIRPPGKATSPYPGGFSGAAKGYLDLYVPPPPGMLPVDFGADGIGSMGFSGPLQSADIGASLTLDGARLLLGEPLQAFSINPATGLFSGRVELTLATGLPATKTVSFKGAVLQSMQRGVGYYKIGNETGFVRFEAK